MDNNEIKDGYPKMDIVGVYKLGNVNDIGVEGQDWHDLLHHTMMAIMASAPKSPKGMTYSAGLHMAGRMAYVVLSMRTRGAPGWRETNKAMLVRKAFDEGREPGEKEDIIIDYTFLFPPKSMAEYKARLAYTRAFSGMMERYQKQLEYIGKALKGEWPKEEE